MTKYRQTFAEAYNSIYESAAATEIQKQVAKGGMDKNMFQKSVDLLKSKKYDELKTFLKKSDTSPREYVMFTILNKEPKTFKKMYGNQTGYLSLMDQNEAVKPFMISYSKDGKHAGFEDGDSLSDIQNKAQKLRAKGFTIDKMGRYNPPVAKEEYIEEVKGDTEAELLKLMKNINPKSQNYEAIMKGLRARMAKLRSMKKEEVKIPDGEDNEEKSKEKDPATLEKTILNLQSRLALVQQKLENEKNKVVKPQPNKDTGEVPLRTGIANAILDKKVDTSELLKTKKIEKLKVGDGKSKVELNPQVDIGVFSGGVNGNNGNLH